MSYNITLSDGSKLTTVFDGTTDTTSTSITLIGKNFAGYGQFLNENFVEMLEHFSNSVSPSNPLQGQIWWNSNTKTLQVWTSTQWKSVSSTTTSATAPISPNSGDLWWDTVNQQLKVWNAASNSWVVIGPAYSSSQGLTGAVAAVVYDTPQNNKHVVVEFYVGGYILAILSGAPNDPSANGSYTLASPISGFDYINPGLNLSSINELKYNGDASNSLHFGPSGSAISYSQYLRSDIDGTLNGNLTISPISITGSNLVISGTNASSISIADTTPGSNVIFSVNTGAGQQTVLTLDATSSVATVSNITSASPGTSVVNKNYVDNNSYQGSIVSTKSSNVIVSSSMVTIANISSSYSSAEFLIQTTSSTGNVQLSKVLAISNNGNSYSTEYGTITNGTNPAAVFSTTISNGALQLVATPSVGAGQVTYKVNITAVTQ